MVSPRDVQVLEDRLLLAATPAPIPLDEGFETGSLSQAWETNSSGAGRIQVTDANGPDAGNFHLTLDSSQNGVPSRNEAILHVDTTGYNDIVLDFRQREFGDEDHQMSTVFTGSEDSDGVALSVDGTTWYRIVDLTGANSLDAYQSFQVNLTQFAVDNGLVLEDDVRIKFQQFDDFGITLDGFAFDAIRVTGTSGNALDYGDAPDTGVGNSTGNYETLKTNGGARHYVVDDLFLGDYVDADDGTLQGPRADADDRSIVKTSASADVPRAIPDNGQVESTLFVDQSFTIDDLDVTLDITHTFVGDLEAFLIAPDGTTVTLFSRRGDDGDNFAGTTLDDEAGSSIVKNTAPFTGRFRPEGSLADFDGKDAFGFWTLRVADRDAFITGTLNSWSLDISTTDQRYVSSDVPLDIPDEGQIESTLVVDESFTITDVDITLDITHEFDGDLSAFLIAPDETVVALFEGGGGNGLNFTGTTLDDEAGTPITNGTAPFAGKYSPTGNLADFDFKDAFGTWTLRIIDAGFEDVGTLNSWSLTFNESPDDEDGVDLADLNVDAGTAPSIDVRVTNRTGADATLYGWIDVNRDGVFEIGERASVVVGSAPTTQVVTLNFQTIPAQFVGSTYARFRLSSDNDAANPNGAASDGEVEDYVFTTSLVVDNGDPEYFEGGSWFDSLLFGYRGSSTRYSQSNGASVRWNVENMAAGWYEVELYNVGHSLNTTAARIETRHSGATASTMRNLLTTPTGFTSIGTFYFEGQGLEYVRMVNEADGTTLRADAVRLRPVAPPTTHTVDNGDPGYAEGGAWFDSLLSGNEGGSTRYSQTNGASVRWNAGNLVPGWYKVRYYNVANVQNSTAARIETSHASGLAVTTRNLRTAPNGFLDVGTFYFDGQSNENVRMVNTAANTTLRADVLQYVPVQPPGLRTVDNGDPGYAEGGAWFDSLLSGFEGGSTRYSQTNGASVRWNAGNLAAGWYTVEYYNVQHQLNSTAARFETTAPGATASITRNLRSTPTGFLTIGTFYFDGRGGEFLRLVNTAPDTTLRADVVRFRAVAPPPPRIVDNGQPGYSEFGGGWTGSGLTGSSGSSTRFTNVTGAGATWRHRDIAPGWYAVEVYNVKHPVNTVNARVTIKHAGITETRTLDQRASPNGFVSVGTFFFDGAGNEAVTLQTLGGLLRADAVRLRSTRPPQTQTQQSAPGEVTESDAATLARTDLDSLIDDALAAWANVGVDPSAFDGVRFAIGDLAGNLLGTYAGGLVTIDVNAAGHGWFVDDTPEDDVEFTGVGPAGFDLFTVLQHELGHHLGLADETDGDGSLLETTLDLGERRHATQAEFDLLADRDLVEEVLNGI